MAGKQKRILVLKASLAIGTSQMAQAQQNEDEWYDPTDWFDGNNYEYDDTWGDSSWSDYGNYDYDYDTGYEYDLWDGTDTVRNDRQYGWHYDWNPVANEWRSDYGYYNNKYDYDAEVDYGWHYDWEPTQNEWVTDYGWHSSNWDYDRSRFDYTKENDQDRQKAERSGKQRKEQGWTSAQQSAGKTGDRHSVQGEIEALRRVTVRGNQGQDQQRTLADVRLQSGQRVVVDLGNRQRSRVQRGDQVVLRGRNIRLNGQDVLLAQQVRVQDQRSNQQATGSSMRQESGSDRSQGRQQNQSANQSGSMTLSGQLQEVRQTNLGGARSNHTLLRVKLENGREEIVDLGSNFAERYGSDRLEQLMERADQGDRITIKGKRQEINSRRILVANQFRLEGSSVLNRRN